MTIRERLSTIGRALTSQSDVVEKPVETKTSKVKTKTVSDVLGGLFNFGTNKLSDEKTISTKLLNQNKEWVYRNNDVIAKEVSTIEFELYRIDLKGGEIEYVEVKEHPLLDLLDRFNSSTTKSDAIYITQSHKKLTGDSFWLLDGNNTDIKNIFVLQPDKIELKIGDPTDASNLLIEGYKYKEVIDGKTIEKIYKPQDIIHFKTPNPNNMFRGYGAVEAAAEVIDINNLTNLTTRKYFENGAITNFVLSTEGRITDEQLKRFKAELRSAYGGVNKAYETMVLGGGLKPEKLSFSNKDMEFLAQLEWYRDKIMVIFGNTKASLGIIDDVNRASHESSILSWKESTVRPDMQAIVNTLNEFLVPRYGDNLVLGFCDPIPENRDDKLVEIEKAKSILTINERRELLDYDPIGPDGDVIPEQASNERADAMAQSFNQQPQTPPVPKSLQMVDLTRVLRRNGIYEKQKTAKELIAKFRPIAEKMIKERKKQPKQKRLHQLFTDEQVMGYYNKQIHIVEVLEQRFENAVVQFLDRLKDKVITNLESEIPKSATKALYDEEAEIIQAGIDFNPILNEVAIAAGQQANQLIGLDQPYLGKNMRPVIAKNVELFAQSMLDTDKALLTGLIDDGLKRGESVAQIRSKIDENFSQYSKMQAQRITRTEVLRASNQASLDAFQESGVVEGKQWLTAGATDECAAYEGKIEWNLNGNFYASDNEFQDGDPPLHPNCKCVLLPVLESSKTFKPSNKMLVERIKELESQIDKRTKEFKTIKKQAQEQHADDIAYIKSLEKYLGVEDGSTSETPEA